jgi:hypothetical protein
MISSIVQEKKSLNYQKKKKIQPAVLTDLSIDDGDGEVFTLEGR